MAKHPITGMDLEDGHGALPHDQQALLHLHYIEQTQGHEAADAMRAKLGLPTHAEQQAAAAPTADHGDRIADLESAHNEHHARLDELEQNAEEHAKMRQRITDLEQRVIRLDALVATHIEGKQHASV